VRGIFGVLLGLLARAWLFTIRVRVEVDAALDAPDAGCAPWVLSFWHGTQWPLLAWRRRRRTVVMVSWSKDGAMQARALARLGLEIVRGSSSRGGARGLAALVRALRLGGRDAAFAVDGPRGPRGKAKPGVVMAARAAGAVLVPIGAAMARGFVFRRAWDRFELAWPFSRVVVRLGGPVDPSHPDALALLEAAIDGANAAARTALDGSPSGELGEAGDRLDLEAGAAR
jgi:lysophospholipid acyltransferase (LPLAT)-like uncharacterized protein